MANFGPLTAEIGSAIWGTSANFNGFRVLASLLHGTLVVGVSHTLRRLTDGGTYIRRAAITLGISPHSSCSCVRRLKNSGCLKSVNNDNTIRKKSVRSRTLQTY